MTVMHALKKAKTSIVLYIYGLTDPEILTLLKNKQAEGVRVTIFYDKKGSKGLPKSLNAYPVDSQGLMHRKILIIDSSQIFLGTANFTTQSLKMHDNLILGIWDPALAGFFSESIADFHKTQVGNMTITSYLVPNLTKLCQVIEEAKESIQIAMFTLTHPQIVQKLCDAAQRGIAVSTAIDHYTAAGASKKAVDQLKSAGVQIYESQGSQLLHHKWAWIDQKTFVLGSANWTAAAFEKNEDCLLILKGLDPNQKKFVNRLWKTLAIASKTS